MIHLEIDSKVKVSDKKVIGRTLLNKKGVDPTKDLNWTVLKGTPIN